MRKRGYKELVAKLETELEQGIKLIVRAKILNISHLFDSKLVITLMIQVENDYGKKDSRKGSRQLRINRPEYPHPNP